MGVFGEIWDALRNPIDYAGEKLGDINYESQKRIQQNAYQNTVFDLKKAGLNPMLAYMNGANAGGSQADIGQLGNPFNTALSVAQLEKTMADASLASASAKDMNAKAYVSEKIADVYKNDPKQALNRVNKENSPTTMVQGASTLLKGVADAARSPQGKGVIKALSLNTAQSAKEVSTRLNNLGRMIRGWATPKISIGTSKND